MNMEIMKTIKEKGRRRWRDGDKKQKKIRIQMNTDNNLSYKFIK